MVKKHIFILLAVALTAPEVFGVCHVTTSTGSGTQSGADWNNASAKLPTTLIRGDVYYLADGNYGQYAFNSPGTAPITIKKATTSDHCTDVGWNPAAMGAAQAVFTGITFSGAGTANNVTLDGNGSSVKPGCGLVAAAASSDCGILIDNRGCTSTASDACDNVVLIGVRLGTPVTGLTLRYMEWAGNDNITSEKQFLYSPANSTGNSYKLEHIYGHDTGCVYVFQYGGSRTANYNYWWKNHSDPVTCHGQYAYHGNNITVVESNSVYRDIEGSAVWFVDNSTSGLLHDSRFFNNIIFYSNPPLRNGTNGILDCANGGTPCQNINFNQNVIANQRGSFSAQVGCIASASGTGNTASNNIWFNNAGEHLGVAGCFTPDHNSYINNTGGGSCGTGCSLSDGGIGAVVASSSPVPFVDWVNGDFRLAVQNSNWGSGATLSSPFNVDMAGNTRPGTDGVWNRGAFEFSGTTASVNPPTNLVVVVH